MVIGASTLVIVGLNLITYLHLNEMIFLKATKKWGFNTNPY